jgi:hypothetical protein
LSLVRFGLGDIDADQPRLTARIPGLSSNCGAEERKAASRRKQNGYRDVLEKSLLNEDD